MLKGYRAVGNPHNQSGEDFLKVGKTDTQIECDPELLFLVPNDLNPCVSEISYSGYIFKGLQGRQGCKCLFVCAPGPTWQVWVKTISACCLSRIALSTVEV